MVEGSGVGLSSFNCGHGNGCKEEWMTRGYLKGEGCGSKDGSSKWVRFKFQGA